MNRFLKKACALCVALVLVCTALPFTAAAQNYNGTIGDNISWTYNDITGRLVITGSGALPDSEIRSYWYNLCYGKPLTNIQVGEGITAIGERVFYGLHCTGVLLPSTLRTIGAGAFTGCSNLDSIIIPDSVRSIGRRALNGCTSLQTVHISRFTTEIGNDLLDGSDKAVICSTAEDCYARRTPRRTGTVSRSARTRSIRMPIPTK